MKDQTVLIKRNINIEGLPKQTRKEYFTDMGELLFTDERTWLEIDKKGNDHVECFPTCYFEEIEFNGLIEENLPTIEELYNWSEYAIQAELTKWDADIILEWIKTRLATK